MRNAEVDATEDRTDGLELCEGDTTTEIRAKPPDEVGVKAGVGDLAEEEGMFDAVKRLGDVDGDCD